MDTLLSIASKFWTKFSALIVLLLSAIAIGSEHSGDVVKVLSWVLGSGSFVTLATALFTTDLEDFRARKESDRELLRRLSGQLPYDGNFIYWMNEFDFSARSFDAVFISRLMTFADYVSRDETIFFHNNGMNKAYHQLIAALRSFMDPLTHYTVREGENRIRGVYRPEEHPPFVHNQENEVIWRRRVDELNETANAVYEAYKNLNILARKSLHL